MAFEQEEMKSKQPTGPPTRAQVPGWIWSAWIAITILLIWVWLSADRSAAHRLSYSAFREQLEKNNVTQVTVMGEKIEGKVKTPVEYINAQGQTSTYQDFVTYLPSFGDEQLMSKLEAGKVEVETRPSTQGTWWPLFLSILPVLLLFGLGYALFSRMRAQGQNMFSVGKSQAKLYDRRRERTTFDDVAGARLAKRELQEIVIYLKEPDRIRRIGGQVPKGVLLVGPPGTGKTLLARAVAGEADVPFFSITGSDFMEMFVGVGASRVRNMFRDAKKAAPSIIFIDELDAIGRHRGAGLGGGHDEREQTLNQLLSEMDGFDPNENVIVMAATNRPDILDPALLRPGRFDRRITVDLPHTQDRFAILKIYARHMKTAPDVDLEAFARGTPGFSGADLKNMLNEAVLLAVRSNREVIEQHDIDEARDKILMGLEREGLVLTEDEKRMVAFHEGGHALVAVMLPNTDPLHKVTIIPRARSMGVTQQLPAREKYIYRREYMLDRLAVMMGGRAAEELVFDTATNGAENDLKQAMKLARQMVLDWGMADKFQHIALGSQEREVFLGEQLGHQRDYSEATAHQVDEEVKSLLSQSYARAIGTLREHRHILDRVADVLMEKEEITGAEVMEIAGISAEERPSSLPRAASFFKKES